MPKTIYSKEYSRLVKKLKAARLTSGLNQTQAGKLFKKDQTFISKVESGQYRLDPIQLMKFSRIYKKDIKYFLR